MRFTDEWKYFVSEASVYRLLKAHAASSRSDHALLTAASISSSRRFSSSQTVGALPAPIVLHFIFKGCISINGSRRHGIGGFLRFDGRIDRVRDSLRASSRNRQWKRRTSRPGSGHPLTKNLEKSGWLCWTEPTEQFGKHSFTDPALRSVHCSWDWHHEVRTFDWQSCSIKRTRRITMSATC